MKLKVKKLTFLLINVNLLYENYIKIGRVKSIRIFII